MIVKKYALPLYNDWFARRWLFGQLCLTDWPDMTVEELEAVGL